jgi:diadenosine tetraphosphate (Ap4A) HIT family hydrolase
MISAMQLTSGIVVGGKVVVEGDPLPDGTVVTILARDADEAFEVPPELEAELLESLAEAARGETISADEVIERLRRIS